MSVKTKMKRGRREREKSETEGGEVEVDEEKERKRHFARNGLAVFTFCVRASALVHRTPPGAGRPQSGLVLA